MDWNRIIEGHIALRNRSIAQRSIISIVGFFPMHRAYSRCLVMFQLLTIKLSQSVVINCAVADNTCGFSASRNHRCFCSVLSADSRLLAWHPHVYSNQPHCHIASRRFVSGCSSRRCTACMTEGHENVSIIFNGGVGLTIAERKGNVNRD